MAKLENFECWVAATIVADIRTLLLERLRQEPMIYNDFDLLKRVEDADNHLKEIEDIIDQM